MHIETIERIVVERVLSISPGIASAEVIYTAPLTLPDRIKGEAYTGLVIIGKGKVIPGGNVQIANFGSLKGEVHEKTMAVSYFSVVLGDVVHVYLEHQSILQFLRC